MTRRLPWATDADAGSAMKPRRTPVQQARHGQPISSDDRPESTAKPHQTSSPVKSPLKERVRKRRTSRTPSISPPPGPPPAELMHEGYHADDIFMIVEDEFQTVAQSFTRHLHHAEYIRMKKKARAAPYPAIAKSDNGMPTETRKNLEAQNIHNRHDVAVKSMISNTGRTSPDGEGETQGKDPWQGTRLAGLMTKDSTQRRTALVGLEQIPSTTRAARGFYRGEGDSPKKREEHRSILEIYGGKTNKGRTSSPTRGSLTEDSNEDSDDDLDAPQMTKPGPKHGRPKSSEIEKPLHKKAGIAPPQESDTLIVLPSPPHPRSEHVKKTKVESNTSRPSSKVSSSSLRRKMDNFDEFRNEDSDDFMTLSKSFSSSIGKTRTRDKLAKEKDKKSRLDDIPTFLV